MKNKLFFFILFNCVCLALPAQQREKRPFWKVELEGALNNYDAWEVEPSITFLPIQYAGISLGKEKCFGAFGIVYSIKRFYLRNGQFFI